MTNSRYVLEKKGDIMKTKIMIAVTLLIIIGIILSVNINGVSYVQASSEDTADEVYDIYYKGKRIRHLDAHVINNGVYLPVDMIGEYLFNAGIGIDEKNSCITIDIAQQNLMLEDARVLDFIRQNMGQAVIPLRNIENEYYMPLDVLKTFFRVTYTIEGDDVYIEQANDIMQFAKINKSMVQVKPSVEDLRSEGLYLNVDDTLEVIKETDRYYKVKTSDGITCFVKKGDVNLFNIDLSLVDYYNTKKRKINYENQKINLVWEYVYRNTPTPPEGKINGIDVLSPTWFYIKDVEGNLGNKADKAYLNDVHNKGYQVWGLVTNSFNSELTHKVLNDEALTQKVIAQLLFYASLYDLDGINVDFESVKDEDRQALTNFVAALRYYTEMQGLNLSIDVMIPVPWTVEYDRAALSELVDFIAVMTYDEHWSKSPTAGSVASHNWVENALIKTLEEVPPQKLLLGIPLYTRLWTEYEENGEHKVQSKSMSMEDVRNLVREKNLDVRWLDVEKQYYIEYTEDNKTYKVWIEDGRSIAHRLGLAEKYDLAGTACWRKGFEDESVWDIFNEVLKNRTSYTNFNYMEYVD